MATDGFRSDRIARMQDWMTRDGCRTGHCPIYCRPDAVFDIGELAGDDEHLAWHELVAATSGVASLNSAAG
jgi:hypothetical protein